MRGSGSRAAVLLLFGLFSWSGGLEIKSLSGSNVTFKVDVSGGPTEIAWFQGTNKIVDLEEGAEPHFYRWKERTIPNLKEGTLLLMSVTPADSGPYRAQLLIGGTYSNKNFDLQVFDHVCQVVIQNSTQENNVTLRCICSGPSTSPPTRYHWINGTSRYVSDHQHITVQMEDEEQHLRCNASNAVSWTNATFTVSAREKKDRTHIVIIISVIAVIILLSVILFIIRRIGRKYPVEIPETTVKFCLNYTGESLTPSEIVLKKAAEILKITLKSPVPCLERLHVQRDMLKIMGVKKEDNAQYKAEVHLGENTTTHTFVCKSAQNGEIEQHDDAETKPVYPENGELKMTIPNTESAERIVWSKDGAEILVLDCHPPSSEGLVLYKGALSKGLVSDDDETFWGNDVRPSGTSVQYKYSLNEAALNSGRLTLYPVIVRNMKNITWRKDGEELTTCEVDGSPESGRLTLKDLKENYSGLYTMETEDPNTAQQAFLLTIQMTDS